MKDWKEEFDKKFLHTGDTIASIDGYEQEIKKFITDALITQKESFIKIIESKRQTPTEEPQSMQVKNCDELNLWLEHTGRNNYNFALDDIKAELEKEDRC